MSKLSEYISSLIKDKNVCILGFGREGKSSYNYIKNVGGFKSITICDLAEIAPIEGASLITGEKYQSHLNEFDIIIKSPGIVLEENALDDISKLYSQTELFLSVYRSHVIGVTGTKGKSTTATLTYHILSHSGRESVLLGNIGIPPFERDDFSPNAYIVFELSSHQLEYTDVSPHIGVFLNIFPEHLDHYGTFEKYYAAKKNIYRFQCAADYLICEKSVVPENTIANTIVFGKDSPLTIFENSFEYNGNILHLDSTSSKLIGAHNVNNIAAAYAVTKILGVSDEEFFSALKTYEPLPHRLMNIGTLNGVTYYDDSISTIPQTTIQALLSLKNVGTLLIGGMDRGIDYTPLIDFLVPYDIENVIFMYDTGKRIVRELGSGLHTFKAYNAENLKEAVELAKKITPVNSICLLSPSAASYGFFKNFEERGDKFKEYVFCD